MGIQNKVLSSFRDPDGFLYRRKNTLYRQINLGYKKNWDFFLQSGLYDNLTKNGLLMPYKESDSPPLTPEISYKVIRHHIIPFISYPFEWSFSQLKDAALMTLRIQKISLEHRMSLKDASAYNIQFVNGKPVFIDTLSFEKYVNKSPWVAYRQFCQHFLCPLSLMCMKDIRLNQLARIYIDGIPLDMAASLLPKTSVFTPGIFMHIHLHAKSQSYFSCKGIIKKDVNKMSLLSLLGVIDSLESTIRSLKWSPVKTAWNDYYDHGSYSEQAFNDKKRLVSKYLDIIKPLTLWDLGSNTGLFSRIAAKMGIKTVSLDADPSCVEKNYLSCIKNKESGILPLLVDLANPSPGIGWENDERDSLIKRGPADTSMALALIHHLAISNNLPFDRIALFFSNICKNLIIEFVPKEDARVTGLLASREDPFPHYTKEYFEKTFKLYFDIISSNSIKDSFRTLYLMRKKSRV